MQLYCTNINPRQIFSSVHYNNFCLSIHSSNAWTNNNLEIFQMCSMVYVYRYVHVWQQYTVLWFKKVVIFCLVTSCLTTGNSSFDRVISETPILYFKASNFKTLNVNSGYCKSLNSPLPPLPLAALKPWFNWTCKVSCQRISKCLQGISYFALRSN